MQRHGIVGNRVKFSEATFVRPVSGTVAHPASLARNILSPSVDWFAEKVILEGILWNNSQRESTNQHTAGHRYSLLVWRLCAGGRNEATRYRQSGR